jgi:UDP-N-acetyl-D-galactosamine dehydrogenase
VGYNPQVILAGRRINDEMARYSAKKVIQLMLRNGVDVARSVIGVMGFTFKENCPDIRNSKVVDLVNELKSWNVKVLVLDPWADPLEVTHEYGISLAGAEQFNGLDSLIVAVGHSQFRALTPVELRGYCKPNVAPVLGDLKALFPRKDAEAAGFSVFRL